MISLRIWLDQNKTEFVIVNVRYGKMFNIELFESQITAFKDHLHNFKLSKNTI